MESLLLHSIDTISIKRDRLIVFLELAHSIRTRGLSMQFKLLCIWLVRSWWMLHCIGMREFMMIYICGLSLLSILFGFITNSLERNQDSLLYNCQPIPSQIIATFYYATFGVSPSLFWNQNYKMTKIWLNEINERIWVNFWGFQMSIVLVCQMFVIWVLDIFHLSFI